MNKSFETNSIKIYDLLSILSILLLLFLFSNRRTLTKREWGNFKASVPQLLHDLDKQNEKQHDAALKCTYHLSAVETNAMTK